MNCPRIRTASRARIRDGGISRERNQEALEVDSVLADRYGLTRRATELDAWHGLLEWFQK